MFVTQHTKIISFTSAKIINDFNDTSKAHRYAGRTFNKSKKLYKSSSFTGINFLLIRAFKSVYALLRIDGQTLNKALSSRSLKHSVKSNNTCIHD